ncbi:hypothetical protein Tco_0173410 [Tanacetum coccineum]
MDSSTRDKTHKGRPWEGSGKKNRDKRDMFSPYKESNLGILQSLTKSPREILTTKSRKYIHEASQNGVQGKRYIQGQANRHSAWRWTTPSVKAELVVDGKKDPILMIEVINNPLKRKEPLRIMSVEEMISPHSKHSSVRRPYPHKCTSLRKANRMGPARWRSSLRYHIRALFPEAQKGGQRKEEICIYNNVKILGLASQSIRRN